MKLFSAHNKPRLQKLSRTFTENSISRSKFLFRIILCKFPSTVSIESAHSTSVPFPQPTRALLPCLPESREVRSKQNLRTSFEFFTMGSGQSSERSAKPTSAVRKSPRNLTEMPVPAEGLCCRPVFCCHNLLTCRRKLKGIRIGLMSWMQRSTDRKLRDTLCGRRHIMLQFRIIIVRHTQNQTLLL